MNKIDVIIYNTQTNNANNKYMNFTHKCNLCGKEYKLKENFNKHYVSCKFFHEACVSSDNNDDHLPTYAELFMYVKETALKCQKLENEIHHLKTMMNSRNKKHILDYLNNDANNEKIIPYEAWCRTLSIKSEHLNEVFEGDMLSGIKKVLEPYLSLENRILLPIRAFSQKHNTLYIYKGDGGWKLVQNNSLEKIIYPLERQFLQAFVIWQKENQEKISLSEKLKDQEIQYMLKLCGSKNPIDKMIHVLKKWLISKIEEEFVHNIVEFD